MNVMSCCTVLSDSGTCWLFLCRDRRTWLRSSTNSQLDSLSSSSWLKTNSVTWYKQEVMSLNRLHLSSEEERVHSLRKTFILNLHIKSMIPEQVNSSLYRFNICMHFYSKWNQTKMFSAYQNEMAIFFTAYTIIEKSIKIFYSLKIPSRQILNRKYD